MNEEIFKLCDWWDLPEGIICGNCYSQAPFVTSTNNYQKRVCESCQKKCFQQAARSHDVSLAMVRYPPFTTNRVTHIAFVGRKSRGEPLSEESFEILQKFSREWSTEGPRGKIPQVGIQPWQLSIRSWSMDKGFSTCDSRSLPLTTCLLSMFPNYTVYKLRFDYVFSKFMECFKQKRSRSRPDHSMPPSRNLDSRFPLPQIRNLLPGVSVRRDSNHNRPCFSSSRLQ
ncbi:hypothetical protein OUZ56_025161 [Daphnia magna]|uniref:CxC3 like cysteine cluster domain-containing protein n=1 Tax=Daphnia magna TaxID=35525 RepID=A0ABQ9ZJ54_9CRUS|nr:hypothetical protein OUZ56_025161 [Daphnia magna]